MEFIAWQFLKDVNHDAETVSTKFLNKFHHFLSESKVRIQEGSDLLKPAQQNHYNIEAN